MELHLPTVRQLTFLSLCCVLATVTQSDSTFVPGRCLCPRTQPAVRGPLKNLTVYYTNPTCDRVTVIVTLRSNDTEVCLDPEAPMGRRLIHCWKRAHKVGRDVKNCLRRRRNARPGRRPGQGSPQRTRGQGRKSLS
ncbi:C-X-C motif chemokine 11 [Takifugu rubripes]|uniref:Chemokine interleukin-8-like domain-containing protein n=1 Tax=Takifugu rubripes TaxID=31033 RepID=A0A674MN11_TAKRU|nr:C-X-C motif chemokine 11 [Takifugu rubripes]|eukprot:XP_003964130.1 PREDICTED: C-X-C motif chemokine 11 [Takifugu rubripes]